MSRANVDKVRRAYEARNRGDFESSMRDAAPEVVIDFTHTGSPYSGIYHGHAGGRRLWDALTDVWEQMSWEPEEFIEIGEHVVVPARSRFRGRGSGIDVDVRGAAVYTFRDGLWIRYTQYGSREQALEAVAARTHRENP